MSRLIYDLLTDIVSEIHYIVFAPRVSSELTVLIKELFTHPYSTTHVGFALQHLILFRNEIAHMPISTQSKTQFSITSLTLNNVSRTLISWYCYISSPACKTHGQPTMYNLNLRFYYLLIGYLNLLTDQDHNIIAEINELYLSKLSCLIMTVVNDAITDIYSTLVPEDSLPDNLIESLLTCATDLRKHALLLLQNLMTSKEHLHGLEWWIQIRDILAMLISWIRSLNNSLSVNFYLLIEEICTVVIKDNKYHSLFYVSDEVFNNKDLLVELPYDPMFVDIEETSQLRFLATGDLKTLKRGSKVPE